MTVVDASAVLAWLGDEFGADVVEAAAAAGDPLVCSAVNWSEVVQKAVARGVALDDVAAAVTLLRLSVLFPPGLEEPITETISADASMPGFTLLHAEGHSSDFSRASSAEQVRGRIQRRVLWMVMEADRLDDVLQLLRTHVDCRDVRWWTEPVLAMGRLG